MYQLLTRVACGAVLLGTVSGCTVNQLKEANQRLRESNDRLVAENNRLEHELAQLHGGFSTERVAAIPENTGLVAANLPAEKPPVDSEIFPVQTFPAEDAPEVIRSADGIHYRFPDRVFFGLGQAKLSRQGQRVLDQMARLLSGEFDGRVIRVDGHTDDVPIRKVRHLYPTNWELSTARACTVVRYLTDQAGISPQRIFPAGFAFHRPASNAKSKNRRVEITILDRSI